MGRKKSANPCEVAMTEIEERMKKLEDKFKKKMGAMEDENKRVKKSMNDMEEDCLKRIKISEENGTRKIENMKEELRRFKQETTNTEKKIVDSIRDLGVQLSSDLTYNTHVELVYSKGLRVIGFIQRNCSDFKNIVCLKVLYCSLVRSIIEFSSVVWNPKQNNLANRLDKLQRRFLRIVAFKLGKTDVNLTILAK